jgi:hypothetical protein
MDIVAVRDTLEQASLASLAIGLAIGFFFSFNLAIPVSLAYVTKAQALQRAVLPGSMFVVGMIVTHARQTIASKSDGTHAMEAWKQTLRPRCRDSASLP